MAPIELNLAKGKQPMSKSVFDRIIDRFSFTDGNARIVFAHFFCLRLRIDEAEISIAQLGEVFNSKAVNFAFRSLFESQSL